MLHRESDAGGGLTTARPVGRRIKHQVVGAASGLKWTTVAAQCFLLAAVGAVRGAHGAPREANRAAGAGAWCVRVCARACGGGAPMPLCTATRVWAVVTCTDLFMLSDPVAAPHATCAAWVHVWVRGRCYGVSRRRRRCRSWRWLVSCPCLPPCSGGGAQLVPHCTSHSRCVCTAARRTHKLIYTN